MKKSHQKKHNRNLDDFEKPHHQAKQVKHFDEEKENKKIRNAIRAKSTNLLYDLEEAY